jgi:predicted RNA binding protein YcfA (HicA-like mRNA interferase family)
MNGRQVIRELELSGWMLVRINGSHHMLKKDGVTVPIPVHGARDIGVGLLKRIEKQTGVKLT